jgi:enoyl-CoA hydratase
MSYETLLFDVAEGIATVTINRPDKLNALNAKTIEEIGDVFTKIAADPAIGVAIVTGAGPKAFVAGADIAELSQKNALTNKAAGLAGQGAFDRIERCGKPVIAAVNGFALGGGCELSLACHIRYASENAKFGQPEVNLGIIPGYGGTQRLMRKVPHGVGLELLLTGRMIDATEAHRIGLVNAVCTTVGLMDECRKLAAEILSKGPLAVRMTLEAALAADDMPLRQGLSFEANLFGLVAATDDHKEGLKAFIEKRKPGFKGT